MNSAAIDSEWVLGVARWQEGERSGSLLSEVASVSYRGSIIAALCLPSVPLKQVPYLYRRYREYGWPPHVAGVESLWDSLMARAMLAEEELHRHDRDLLRIKPYRPSSTN